LKEFLKLKPINSKEGTFLNPSLKKLVKPWTKFNEWSKGQIKFFQTLQIQRPVDIEYSLKNFTIHRNSGKNGDIIIIYTIILLSGCGCKFKSRFTVF